GLSRRAGLACTVGLALDLAALHLETRQFARQAFARRGRGLERMTQRRGGIHRREHLAARGLDVAFGAFDLLVGRAIGLFERLEGLARLGAFALGPRRGLAPRLELT